MNVVPQTNVGVVRAVYEAWNRGGPEAAKPFWTSDLEYVPPRDQPDGKVIRGREAFVAEMERVRAFLGDFRFTVYQVIDAANDDVVTLFDVHVRGVESGAPIAGRWAHVSRVGNGKVARVQVFTDWDQALEAAGLRRDEG